MCDHKKLRMVLPIGGHIDANEDPIDALFREIKEETGKQRSDLVLNSVCDHVSGICTGNAKPLPRPRFLDIHSISENHHHIGIGYQLLALTLDVSLAPDEHNSLAWMNAEDVRHAWTTPLVAHYCLTTLDEIAAQFRNKNS